MADAPIMNNDLRSTNSRPPVVDFSAPFNSIDELKAKRQQLKLVIQEIEECKRDVSKYEIEASRNAQIATMWAATLMVTNILKTGMKSMDRRARVLFNAQDKAIEKADKILQRFGAKKFATRNDILDNLDPNLKGYSQALKEMRTAKKILEDAGAKGNKETQLVFDLGVTMAEDSLMIMQGMQDDQRARSSGDSARRIMNQNLQKLKNSVMKIDTEINRMYEKCEIRSRTA